MKVQKVQKSFWSFAKLPNIAIFPYAEVLRYHLIQIDQSKNTIQLLFDLAEILFPK